MLTALAAELTRARTRRSLSLQAAAGPSKITAAYLHKLERANVETPSPHVLGRLAATLGIPYLRLMELAGYLDEAQLASLGSRAPRPHPLAGQQLSPDEWRAVGALIEDLEARRVRRPGHARPAKGRGR